MSIKLSFDDLSIEAAGRILQTAADVSVGASQIDADPGSAPSSPAGIPADTVLNSDEFESLSQGVWFLMPQGPDAPAQWELGRWECGGKDRPMAILVDGVLFEPRAHT